MSRLPFRLAKKTLCTVKIVLRTRRLKISHFQGRIAYGAAKLARERNKRIQCELTTFDSDFGSGGLVRPADCPGNWVSTCTGLRMVEAAALC